MSIINIAEDTTYDFMNTSCSAAFSSTDVAIQPALLFGARGKGLTGIPTFTMHLSSHEISNILSLSCVFTITFRIFWNWRCGIPYSDSHVEHAIVVPFVAFKRPVKYAVHLSRGLVGRNFNLTHALLGVAPNGSHFSLAFFVQWSALRKSEQHTHSFCLPSSATYCSIIASYITLKNLSHLEYFP